MQFEISLYAWSAHKMSICQLILQAASCVFIVWPIIVTFYQLQANKNRLSKKDFKHTNLTDVRLSNVPLLHGDSQSLYKLNYIYIDHYI